VPARHARRRCWIETDHTLRLLDSSSGTAIRRSWVIYTLRLFFCSGGTAIRRRWVIYVAPRVLSELILAGSRVVAESAGERLFFSVHHQVACEVGFLGCPILTDTAGKRLGPCVGLLMLCEGGLVGTAVLASPPCGSSRGS
jgi:hypothetical protein